MPQTSRVIKARRIGHPKDQPKILSEFSGFQLNRDKAPNERYKQVVPQKVKIAPRVKVKGEEGEGKSAGPKKIGLNTSAKDSSKRNFEGTDILSSSQGFSKAGRGRGASGQPEEVNTKAKKPVRVEPREEPSVNYLEVTFQNTNGSQCNDTDQPFHSFATLNFDDPPSQNHELDQPPVVKMGHTRSMHDLFQPSQAKPRPSQDQGVHMDIANYNERRQAKISKATRKGVFTLKLKHEKARAEPNQTGHFKSASELRKASEEPSRRQERGPDPGQPAQVSPVHQASGVVKKACSNAPERQTEQAPARKDGHSLEPHYVPSSFKSGKQARSRENLRTLQQHRKSRHHQSTGEFLDFDPNIFKNKNNFGGNRNSLPEFFPEKALQGANLFSAETTERFNVITKFAFATSAGQQSHKVYKQNQDAYIIQPNIMGHLGLHLFGICDGHGPHGHAVSNFAKESLSTKIMQQTPSSLIQAKSLAKIEQLHSSLPAILHNSFLQVHKDLSRQEQFDTQFR